MMQKSHLLLFALFMFAVSAASNVNAQDPELYFYPSQGWDVAKSMPIDGETDSEICTIMAQYNNGFVLSFSGQNGGIIQMDVDFRQPVFQTGAKYNTTVNIPGAFNRSIAVNAQQTQMITINIKDHSPFYNAVKQVGVLDLEVEQNKFRFYLTGINAASTRLDECMGVQTSEPQAIAQNIEPEAPKALSAPPAINMATMKPEKKPDAPAAEKAPRPEPPTKRMAETIAAEMEKINETAHVSLDKPVITKVIEKKPVITATIPPAAAAISTPIKQPKVKMINNAAQKNRVARAINTGPSATDPVKRPHLEEQKQQVAEITPPPKTTSYKTPPFKTTTQTHKTVEIDFTHIEDEKPATPQPKLKPVPVKEIATVPAVPHTEPAPVIATPNTPHITAAPANTRQLAAIKIENDKLKQENEILNARLLATLKREREEKASIASDNWDLERATLRYNEAERQLENMGQKLKQLRAKCDQEKRSLESMLFDPAVTSQQQLAKLAGMEDEIRKLKQDMELQRRRYEEQIRLLQQQMLQAR